LKRGTERYGTGKRRENLIGNRGQGRCQEREKSEDPHKKSMPLSSTRGIFRLRVWWAEKDKYPPEETAVAARRVISTGNRKQKACDRGTGWGREGGNYINW